MANSETVVKRRKGRPSGDKKNHILWCSDKEAETCKTLLEILRSQEMQSKLNNYANSKSKVERGILKTRALGKANSEIRDFELECANKLIALLENCVSVVLQDELFESEE